LSQAWHPEVMLSGHQGGTPSPNRLWQFEAEHPLLANLAVGAVVAIPAWLLWRWTAALGCFFAFAFFGTLGWRSGGARRRRYEAQVSASRAAVDGTTRRHVDVAPNLPANRRFTVLTAVVSLFGAGLVLVLLGLQIVFGGSLGWGSREVTGLGLELGLAALALVLLVAGLLSVRRPRLGVAISLVIAILGSVLSGIGMAAGGSAGPLPAAHWWLLLVSALAALVLDRRNGLEKGTNEALG
jgi:hypothetical protein